MNSTSQYSYLRAATNRSRARVAAANLPTRTELLHTRAGLSLGFFTLALAIAWLMQSGAL